jgi:hypothetical protein
VIKGEVIRWSLLALGALLGLGSAFLYGWCFYQFRGPPGRDSFAQLTLVLGCCATMFVVIYNVGIWGHHLFGMEHEAGKIRRHRRWHMLLLNTLAILIMIAGWIFD